VRARVGNLRLGDLPCGHWRALTRRELQSLEGRAPASPRSMSQELHPPSSNETRRL
jgi:hypothetical protein